MPAVTPGEAKASVSPGKGSKKEVITRRDPHALAKRNFEKKTAKPPETARAENFSKFEYPQYPLPT